MSLAGNLAKSARMVLGALAGKNIVTSADVDASVNVKLAGDVVQVVNYQTGALATGTGIIPCDDTIPQITEGTEFMTLAITPTSATNKLKIEVVVMLGNSAASQAFVAALFKDSNADAIAMQTQFMATLGGFVSIHFVHYMTAGATSPITFRVRCGANNYGTTSFNGLGTRFYGGAAASSITITEIKA